MRIIEVIAGSGHTDTIASIATQNEVLDLWTGAVDEQGRRAMRMLVRREKQQQLIDALQSVLGAGERVHILIEPVEGVWPRPEEAARDDDGAKALAATREELFSQIEGGTRLDAGYLWLVFLSTIVASIGLLKDNVAVVVGAMVIAPLLGPNLAFALAAALGDRVLMWQALKTGIAGFGLALLLAMGIGALDAFGPIDVASVELTSRTEVDLDGVVLALASGAAAVLSLTTGLPTALVGVMVAVALLPPTATLGMLLGAGRFDWAVGAGMLLAVNIVCVNLAANIVFMIKGVKPRTWLEKRKARQSNLLTIAVWLISLLLLLAVMLMLHGTR